MMRVLTAFKVSLEQADFMLRALTFLAIVGWGGWALYQYKVSGSDGWTNNLTLETKVLPYHDNLRLLVVHVKSKNPRSYEFELKSKLGDSFVLRIRKVAADLKENTVIAEDEGDLIKTIDLMKNAGGDYELLPGAEMDDMNSIVLPVNTIVALTADMEIHDGTLDAHGKPNTDFIPASSVVRIEPWDRTSTLFSHPPIMGLIAGEYRGEPINNKAILNKDNTSKI